ncbi:hypothetical protein LIER_15946 [Lithospermum erythrorhizon]|uniref:Uncharacterized protein n=1 Tax=Lithospermum erythrorhizon TaxID=34254 RepID=A0AAV3Q7A6_LITER
MKDLGILKYFLVIENHNLSVATGPLLADPEPYKRLVGRLIYFSYTRPDLTYIVQTPRQHHWDACLRVVRYLKGSPGQVFLGGSPIS